jgi:hypothetical protein
MKTRESTLAAAFPTGGFALIGYAGSSHVGQPPWVGTVVCGAIGLLVGLWSVFQRAKDDGPR